MSTLQKQAYDTLAQRYGMLPSDIIKNSIEYQLLDLDGVNCIDLGKCIETIETTYHWHEGPMYSGNVRFEQNNDHDAFGNLRNLNKDGLRSIRGIIASLNPFGYNSMEDPYPFRA